jgi:hypothetical protein
MRQAQMIRRLLYNLKRDWGTTFDWVQIQSSEVDDRTGTRQVKRKAYQLPGVLLPQNQVRKFMQDIGYLAANKNFTYGALNDYNTIKLLFLKYDVPPEVHMDLDGYITYGGKRYERVSFDNLAEEAFLLVARGVEGANPYSQIAEKAFSTLHMQGRVSYELN